MLIVPTYRICIDIFSIINIVVGMYILTYIGTTGIMHDFTNLIFRFLLFRYLLTT